MKITSVQLNNTTKRLVPLSKYKGPKLDLMFYEKEEIALLRQELMRLENEARDVIRTVNINRHLTGSQKNRCAFKLMNIETSIEAIKNKIYQIKQHRFAIQKEEYERNNKF